MTVASKRFWAVHQDSAKVGFCLFMLRINSYRRPKALHCSIEIFTSAHQQHTINQIADTGHS